MEGRGRDDQLVYFVSRPSQTSSSLSSLSLAPFLASLGMNTNREGWDVTAIHAFSIKDTSLLYVTCLSRCRPPPSLSISSLSIEENEEEEESDGEESDGENGKKKKRKLRGALLVLRLRLNDDFTLEANLVQTFPLDYLPLSMTLTRCPLSSSSSSSSLPNSSLPPSSLPSSSLPNSSIPNSSLPKSSLPNSSLSTSSSSLPSTFSLPPSSSSSRRSHHRSVFLVVSGSDTRLHAYKISTTFTASSSSASFSSLNVGKLSRSQEAEALRDQLARRLGMSMAAGSIEDGVPSSPSLCLHLLCMSAGEGSNDYDSREGKEGREGGDGGVGGGCPAAVAAFANGTVVIDHHFKAPSPNSFTSSTASSSSSLRRPSSEPSLKNLLSAATTASTATAFTSNMSPPHSSTPPSSISPSHAALLFDGTVAAVLSLNASRLYSSASQRAASAHLVIALTSGKLFLIDLEDPNFNSVELPLPNSRLVAATNEMHIQTIAIGNLSSSSQASYILRGEGSNDGGVDLWVGYHSGVVQHISFYSEPLDQREEKEDWQTKRRPEIKSALLWEMKCPFPALRIFPHVSDAETSTSRLVLIATTGSIHILVTSQIKDDAREKKGEEKPAEHVDEIVAEIIEGALP